MKTIMWVVVAALVLSIAFILNSTRGTTDARVPVRVAIASNLGSVMEELAASFNESYPGIKIEFITGSSGKLAAQIINGAPFDIFLSADMRNPEILYSMRLAGERPRAYATGTLILFTTGELPLRKAMELLNLPAIKRIALADPVTAPYGKAAVESMKNAGVYTAVYPKLVNAPTVSEVIAYTRSGADIGFTALSLLKSPWMKKYDVRGKYWMEVDKNLYAPVKQGMVILARGRRREQARAFYEFLSSAGAKNIFKKYGYE